MKIVYKPLSPFGFEQVIIEQDQDIPASHTEVEPPVPNWKPAFDFDTNKWIEMATDEEKQGSAVDDVTEIDQLKKENEELQKQITDTQVALAEVYEMMLGGGV